MSYREEYNKYVKRELNDSYIKDGRTIEYKPHYHSFDEWFEAAWNSKKGISTNFYGEVSVDIDLMGEKVLEDYKMFYNWRFHDINTRKTSFKFKLNSNFDDKKERKNEYKNALNSNIGYDFNEFLKQDLIIWSEDDWDDKYRSNWKVDKRLWELQFTKKAIQKYGKSSQIIINVFKDNSSIDIQEMRGILRVPYYKKIILKKCQYENIKTIILAVKDTNWKILTDLNKVKDIDIPFFDIVLER